MMNTKELQAAITAAQEELAKLQAMTPDPEPLHPVTIPMERAVVGGYFRVIGDGSVYATTDCGHELDDKSWRTANYYSTLEQATAYAAAFEVLRLMRRQPGIVDPEEQEHFFIGVSRYKVSTHSSVSTGSYLEIHMFPAYESHDAARAAVAAVGEARIIKAAKWLAGVVE